MISKKGIRKIEVIFGTIMIILILLTQINFGIKNSELGNTQNQPKYEGGIVDINNIDVPKTSIDVDVKDSYVYLITEYYSGIFSYFKFENNILESLGYIEDPYKINKTFLFLYQIEIQDDYMYILGVKEYQQAYVSFFVAEFLDNHSINVISTYTFNTTNGYPLNFQNQNLVIENNYAFTGITWQNISHEDPAVCQATIFNISNKTNPVEIGNYTELGVCSDLVVQNNKIFLLIEKQRKYNSTDGLTYYIGENKLIVLDVSNQSNPIKIQHLTLSFRPCSVAVYNNYLYLSYYESSLEIYDIEEINNPVLIKSTNIESRKIVFKDDLTYILENEKLIILDTTQIDDFEKIGEEKVRYRGKNGIFHDCVIEDDYVFCVRQVQYYGTFIIFDCSDLNNPKVVYPEIQADVLRNQIILIIVVYIFLPSVIISILIIVIRLQIMKKRKKVIQNKD